jgi:hypothetical protein
LYLCFSAKHAYAESDQNIRCLSHLPSSSHNLNDVWKLQASVSWGQKGLFLLATLLKSLWRWSLMGLSSDNPSKEPVVVEVESDGAFFWQPFQRACGGGV